MSKLDPFSAQIVDLVRHQMSDEAILELVRNQLGAVGAKGSSATPAPRTSAAPKAAKAAPKRAARKPAKKKKANESTLHF